MQVSVRSAFPTGAVITMVPPVGDCPPPPPPPPPPGDSVLVVDPCVVGDGWVVQVAAWVKKGGVRTGTRLLVRSGSR